MTIQAYAESIALLVEFYNLTSNRKHRLTGAMIAAGVPPTPAGLWTYGFGIGLGYAKAVPTDLLYSRLLPQGVLEVKPNGGFFQDLEYSGPVFEKENWTTRAKQLGVFGRTINFFPNSAARIWLPSPGSNAVEELRLTSEANVPHSTTHEEWLDARKARTSNTKEREHAKLVATIEKNARRSNLVKRETELTRDAEASASRDRPTVSEARAMENQANFMDSTLLPSALPASVREPLVRGDDYAQAGGSIYEQMFFSSDDSVLEDRL